MSASLRSFDLQLAHSHAALAQLPEPQTLFKHLLMCLETPRPSNEPGVNNLALITKKLLDFGASHGLDCAVDSAGNVRLRQKASAGFEKATAIVVQSHMDVVCSKSNDKVHDFAKDCVTPIVEGNVLRADRTTLGADDGIGVAAAMALFEETDPEFVHGPLEAVFTVDEETTMGGAEGIDKAPFLQSTVMLNVDSEESGNICVGCAGGFEKKMTLPLVRARVAQQSADMSALQLHLHSLLGGHTGIDIHKGRANALQIVARILDAAQAAAIPVQLLSLAGGNAPNAIPRDATFRVMLPTSTIEAFRTSVAKTLERVRGEFKDIERKLAAGEVEGSPDAKYVSSMQLDITDFDATGALAASAADTRKVVALMLNVPHGPLKVNVALDHAVDTSISFSLVALPADLPAAAADAAAAPVDGLLVHVFCRSSFDQDMRDVDARLEALAQLAGAVATPTLNYFPGWDPRLDSPALKQVVNTYKLLNAGKEPKVYSVHAGLECGLFKLAYPDLDCVSIGPTIHHAHSPDECLMIDTVQPFYEWLKQSIVNISKDSIKQ